jgi:hypothetical protein
LITFTAKKVLFHLFCSEANQNGGGGCALFAALIMFCLLFIFAQQEAGSLGNVCRGFALFFPNIGFLP